MKARTNSLKTCSSGTYLQRWRPVTPNNYRAVSLTPILMSDGKIVRENIVTFLTENNLFNRSQHGSMKGRSCLLALLSVYDELINNLSNCQPSCIDMIYLDFAKTFDKVDHGVFLHKKLKSMSITGDLRNWLLNFLSDRKHFDRMPGGISNDGPQWCTSRYCVRPFTVSGTFV